MKGRIGTTPPPPTDWLVADRSGVPGGPTLVRGPGGPVLHESYLGAMGRCRLARPRRRDPALKMNPVSFNEHRDSLLGKRAL